MPDQRSSVMVMGVLRSARTSVDQASARTVVLVEDHSAVREGISELLIAAGFDVIAAVGTCQDGYTAIVANRPDLAIIDDRLPDGRGVDLCWTLAAAAPDVPIVIYANAATPRDKQRAREAGAAAIIEKALHGRALLDTIAVIPRSTPKAATP